MRDEVLDISDNGLHAVPSPEYMLWPEFRAIIDRAKKKDTGLRELSYVYHMISGKSVYNSYDKDLREEKIIHDIMPKGWKRDKVVEKAMERYEESTKGPIAYLMDSAISAIHKTRKYLDSVDFDEVDEDGNPLYSMSDIKNLMGMLANLGKTVSGLNELQDQVLTEKGAAKRAMKGVQIDPVFND